jgi:hypothetical protein
MPPVFVWVNASVCIKCVYIPLNVHCFVMFSIVDIFTEQQHFRNY